MDDDKRYYERPFFWPRLIGGIILFVFIIAFRSEILLLLRVVWAFLKYLFSSTRIDLPRETPSALLVLLVNLVIYLCVYFIALSWVSLFVLPVHNSHEKQKVYERLTEYVFGVHGPAVFVKNGELITRKEEEIENEGVKARFPSLAFIDLASAIVVEGGSLPPILNVTKEPVPEGKQFAPIRVHGPGIAFLTSGERIRGCVDLRKQVRAIKEIHGFTSDGIELSTNVSVTFTLGQPPDVITVFESREQGLRGMNIDRETHKVSISDKVNEADATEIRTNIQRQRPSRTASPAYKDLSSNRPPYAIGEEHIISAVLSQPRNTKDGKLERWTELPAQVAVSVLLEGLSRVSYDQLYSLDSPSPDCYLYRMFKPEFVRKIKEMGILSYQFVQRKDGRTPYDGEIFIAKDYLIWDVMELHNPKPLRDWGIKVIGVGFSDFKPVDNTVPEQRFDSWRARWQKRTELTNAEYDLEVMRKMNHARAQAQREIIYNLSQIFKLPGYTRDAMAIRIFQALESAAADPATNRLLPGDTVNMLGNFQRLLFSQEQEGRSPDDLPPKGQGQDQ